MIGYNRRINLLLILVTCFTASFTLTGCFKEWSEEEVKEWYQKQPDTWDEYMAAANVARGSGRLDKAAERYQQAMDKAEAEYGPNDNRVATSANAFAALQVQRFKYAEAEGLYLKGLEVQKKTLPYTHPEVIETRKALAAVENNLYKPEEAKKLLEGIKATAVKTSPRKKRTQHGK